MDISLFSSFLFRITFLIWRENNDPLFRSHPEGSCICHSVLSVNVCPRPRTLAFADGTNVRASWTSTTFWNLTTKMHLQRAERMKLTWCTVRAVCQLFKTLPSKLLQQGCHLLGCVGSWYQVIFIFSAFWGNIWWPQMPNSIQRCMKLSYSGSVCKSTILCWGHALPDNTW